MPFSNLQSRLAEELLEEEEEESVLGWVLGDRNHHSPNLAEWLLDEEGLHLLAPYKFKSKEEKRWPRWLVQKRRRIETLISQLTEGYRSKKVWVRDRWHLTVRWLRKVLRATLWLFFCASRLVCHRCALQSSLPTKTCTPGLLFA